MTEANFQADPTAAVLSHDTLIGLASIGFQHLDKATTEHIDRALSALPPVITEQVAENIFLGVETFVEEDPPVRFVPFRYQGAKHARAALDHIAVRAEAKGDDTTVEGIAKYLQKREERRSRQYG